MAGRASDRRSRRKLRGQRGRIRDEPGLSLRLAAGLGLTPGLRYTRFSIDASELDVGGVVEVLVLDLGIRLR